ncbi:hypothetical protein CONLIGDRAFT_699249 [Coniochaeta ligniaria NRRL 30616]|uniref:Uncharacterized protein n=1 Tax=Coniochaeta ligniaria NRRL 30616 TaxID=1408157 RepID=A0A1J7JSZ3_9PEZI|nr:hypothetical protein CONLIGDRAFT_699249 [Coniochaeta ligniaria NRRL 30616]
MRMTVEEEANRDSESAQHGLASTTKPVVAPFTGYRQFPPVMNLYANYAGVFKAMKTYKLCGATAEDVLYLVEVHFGYTPRGPLNFGRGLYLRNGTRFRDHILAAAGEVSRFPLLITLFNPKTAVLLPPLDMEKNPTDKVTEILHASTCAEHATAFKFTIEVGVKKIEREAFEWRKLTTTGKGSRYKLHRLVTDEPNPATSSGSGSLDDATEVLAELSFENVLSFNHLFGLELKGAGLTGEMGDRWTLMVVMTALAIHWQRYYGKTNKTIVSAAQKFDDK